MPDPNSEPLESLEPFEEHDEDVDGAPNGIVRLLLTVLPVVLIPALVGGFLAYSQYLPLAQTAVSNGIHFGIVKEAEAAKPIEYGQFTTITDLLINPKDSGGKRFLVISLGVETKSSEVIGELEQKDIVVRDAILQILSARTSEELSSIALRESLKEEILERLNVILQKGDIDRLYFTQYLLQ